jgi:hypothetical protein
LKRLQGMIAPATDAPSGKRLAAPERAAWKEARIVIKPSAKVRACFGTKTGYAALAVQSALIARPMVPVGVVALDFVSPAKRAKRTDPAD